MKKSRSKSKSGKTYLIVKKIFLYLVRVRGVFLIAFVISFGKRSDFSLSKLGLDAP
jgi:hypothetical protein